MRLTRKPFAWAIIHGCVMYALTPHRLLGWLVSFMQFNPSAAMLPVGSLPDAAKIFVYAAGPQA